MTETLPTAPEVGLLSRKAAAKLLGVCLRTLDSFVAAGQLKVVRLGAAVRLDPKDLREFIERQKV